MHVAVATKSIGISICEGKVKCSFRQRCSDILKVGENKRNMSVSTAVLGHFKNTQGKGFGATLRGVPPERFFERSREKLLHSN